MERIMYCNYCGKIIGASLARKSLIRPLAGRKVAGVCLGVAEYFDLDVTLVRFVWLLALIFGGFGLLGYVVAWIVIPSQAQTASSSEASGLIGVNPPSVCG